MLSYEYLNDAVELSNSKIPVLVIENKKIFRQALRSFLNCLLSRRTLSRLISIKEDFLFLMLLIWIFKIKNW